MTVRPTVFGLAVAAALIVGLALSPPVADPSVTGLVWAGLAGAAVLGALWPIVAVRSLRMALVRAPSDLVVGQLGTVEVDMGGRLSGSAVGVAGAGAVVVDVVAPGRVRVPFTVGRRGAYRQLRVTVSSDAPFGIVHVTTTRVLDLPHQLLVGPVIDAWPVDSAPLGVDLAEPTPAGSSWSGDSVRAVRPYVSGDPAHLVHWPSTARSGSLVVRELEPPAADAVAIVVDLGDKDPEHGGADRLASLEQVASRAAGAAREARSSGARVMLCTAEAAGPVAAEVPDEISTQRRLALAVQGAVAAAPDGWREIRLTPATDAPLP